MNVQPKDTSKRHFYVSLAKSALRLVGASAFIALGHITNNWLMMSGGVLLFAAEVLGIVEEL